jgi:hypothetical protein
MIDLFGLPCAVQGKDREAGATASGQITVLSCRDCVEAGAGMNRRESVRWRSFCDKIASKVLQRSIVRVRGVFQAHVGREKPTRGRAGNEPCVFRTLSA